MTSAAARPHVLRPSFDSARRWPEARRDRRLQPTSFLVKDEHPCLVRLPARLRFPVRASGRLEVTPVDPRKRIGLDLGRHLPPLRRQCDRASGTPSPQPREREAHGAATKLVSATDPVTGPAHHRARMPSTERFPEGNGPFGNFAIASRVTRPPSRGESITSLGFVSTRTTTRGRAPPSDLCNTHDPRAHPRAPAPGCAAAARATSCRSRDVGGSPHPGCRALATAPGPGLRHPSSSTARLWEGGNRPGVVVTDQGHHTKGASRKALPGWGPDAFHRHTAGILSSTVLTLANREGSLREEMPFRPRERASP